MNLEGIILGGMGIRGEIYFPLFGIKKEYKKEKEETISSKFHNLFFNKWGKINILMYAIALLEYHLNKNLVRTLYFHSHFFYVQSREEKHS